jgi:hypothetical protein
MKRMLNVTSRPYFAVRKPCKIVKTRMWNPVPVGSMMWYFRKDINIIKQEILNYANTK